MWNRIFFNPLRSVLFPFPIPGQSSYNFNTLPVVTVQVNSDNVNLDLPNGAYRNRPYVGSFFINLRDAIPAGTTATLPIVIGTNGDTRPLMETSGTPVTVANIAGPGIYEIHYNKYTNELCLVNGGYRPSTATTTANVPSASE